jgi:hypothetical protein
MPGSPEFTFIADEKSTEPMPGTPLEPIWSLVEGRHGGYAA